MSGTGSNNNNKGKGVARPAVNNPALTAQRFEQELANAPPDVQDKLRALLQKMALGNAAGGAGAASSGKEPKSMEEHKFWKTQPVVKHGNHIALLSPFYVAMIERMTISTLDC